MNPLVSVVMPVFNGQKYLEDSINSILSQTYTNFEFIIIDDGSIDLTSAIIQRLKKNDNRIRLIQNKKNIGVTKSLNKALEVVKGKYVARMDADDWAYPDRLKRQVRLMENHPEVVLSGSYIEVCNADLDLQYIRRYQLKDEEIRKRMFRYSPFAHPSTIWRASTLKKEKYNEKIEIGQDYELYFRIGRLGKFMNVNKPLLKLRMHKASVSSSMSNLQSKATIGIRRMAVTTMGYKMSLVDKIYNMVQEYLIRLIPVRIRFLLFNFLRRYDFY